LLCHGQTWIDKAKSLEWTNDFSGKEFEEGVMKTRKLFLFLVAVLIGLTVFGGCGKSSDERSKGVKAPFFDGLELKYDVTAYSGNSAMPGHEDWSVVATDYRGFKITKKSYTHAPDGRQVQIMSRTFVLNENGVVTDCEIKSYEGGYSPIWIAVGNFEVGEHLRDAGMKVFEKTTWNGWDTYRISDKPNSINFYYELDQGFLVGTDGAGLRQELILIENNAGIPTSYR
jgi:hypothetical protein